jgi:hypothetical protein
VVVVVVEPPTCTPPLTPAPRYPRSRLALSLHVFDGGEIPMDRLTEQRSECAVGEAGVLVHLCTCALVHVYICAHNHARHTAAAASAFTQRSG